MPPDPPPTVEVTLPDGRFALATITARQAVAALATTPPGAPGPRARISAVTFGAALFGTDRGGRVLPAWLFRVDGANGALAWPAIAPSAWRQATEVIHGTRITADGRTLVATI